MRKKFWPIKKIVQSKYAEPESKDPKSIVLDAVLQNEKAENKELENFEKDIKADIQKDVNVGIGEDIQKDDFENEIVEKKIIENKAVEKEINPNVEKNINADAEKDADVEKDVEINSEEEHKESRPLSLYRKIALSFIVLTVSLLAVIFLFFCRKSVNFFNTQARALKRQFDY